MANRIDGPRKQHLENLRRVVVESKTNEAGGNKKVNLLGITAVAGVAKMDTGRVEADEIGVILANYRGARMSTEARREYLKLVTGNPTPPGGPVDGPVALYAVTIGDWTRRINAGEVSREVADGVSSAIKVLMKDQGGAERLRGRAAAAAMPLSASVSASLAALPEDQQLGAIHDAFAAFEAARKKL